MGKIFNEDGTLYIPISGKLKLPTEKVIESHGQAVVTEAYCQNGHSLIGDVKINEQSGLNFLYTDQEGKKEAKIVISPVVGDRTKVNLDKNMFEKDEVVKVLCPHCRNELPVLFICECEANVIKLTTRFIIHVMFPLVDLMISFKFSIRSNRLRSRPKESM